jgi:hypothetical protein
MSSRTLPAGFVPPCLPSNAPTPSGAEWVHEIKFDGFRVIARKNDKRVKLYSRPSNDLTYRFPLIVEALARLRSRSCIIDGEAVACGHDGIPSFDRIRYRRLTPLGLMSAIASSGHNTENAYRRLVPEPAVSRCSKEGHRRRQDANIPSRRCCSAAGLRPRQTSDTGKRWTPRAMIGAKSGVATSVPVGEKCLGLQAWPVRDFLRASAALRRLAGRESSEFDIQIPYNSNDVRPDFRTVGDVVDTIKKLAGGNS